MKKIGKIRIQLTEILTKKFGDKNEGLVFKPEDTLKRTGGGEKCNPDTSSNWSAEAENSERCLWVSGVGMTMSEFIDLFRKNQIYYTVGTNSSFQQITAYKKVPNWETEGYVKAIDKNNRWCCRNGDIQIFYSCNISMMSIIMSPLLQHYLFVKHYPQEGIM